MTIKVFLDRYEREGSHTISGELYTQCRDNCVKWLLKQGNIKDVGTAKDIFTDALLILLDNAERGKIAPSDTQVLTYLTTICRNTQSNAHKRKDRASESDFDALIAQIADDNTEGSLESNDVASIGIYHKMGQKATPAMHLGFGEKDDCIGHLLGAENRGLPQMFLMMNGARIGVGMAGVHIGSAAYYASLQYAHERPQGRRLNEKNALGEPTTIIHHPDVRRMLLHQKAFVEGGLCLILQCLTYLDMEKAHPDPAVKQHYNDLLELLTPVAKTYGAEAGTISVNQGLQVLGGYGYTEDFELEQLARDVRIMSLYEGTTGIQAQAILGRQIPRNNANAVNLWLTEVKKDIKTAQSLPKIKPYAALLTKELKQWEKTTTHLLAVAAKGDSEVFLSDATLYLELFGILNVSWQWLRMGIVAGNALVKMGVNNSESAFYVSKIHTMQFFFHYELPKTKGLTARLLDEQVLTVFDGNFEAIF